MKKSQKTIEPLIQENNLETKQSQIFLLLYNQSFANPIFIKALKNLYRRNSENMSEDEHFKLDSTDSELKDSLNYIASFFNLLGSYVREGLIDIRLLANSITSITLYTWDIFSSILGDRHDDIVEPYLLGEWEYLVNELYDFLEENPEIEICEEVGDALYRVSKCARL
jgi:hypothetical protein